MIGTTIRNHKLIRELGSGGMGTVYYAEHVHSGAKNARVFKILRPELTGSEIAVQRFLNEASAASKLVHRNIVHVRDWDKLGNSWWIEMDWTPGVTLAQFMEATGRPFTEQVLAHIGLEIINGMVEAHENGIIHRDLKPENIWLGSTKEDPFRAQVLDFGVAKLVEDGAAGLTVAGTVVGTHAYMPLEALSGGVITPAVDIWAIGAILYQMATGGWLPYQHHESRGEYFSLSQVQLFERQRTGAIVDPRDRNPKLSERVAQVILTALQPDLSRRYANARALGRALAEALLGDGFHSSGLDLAAAFAPEILQLKKDERTLRDPHAIAAPPPKISRYQLGTKLGSGGMAEVFRGSIVGVEGFARPVAIKRVLAGFSDVPEFAKMFIDEAQIASQLNHQNVVSVIDFDRDPEGRLFLVMEFVPGKDLAALCETGPLPSPVAIYVLTEMLRGLQHAHESQLIHRDISPHNVLLSWNGGVKVSDFGIAKALDASGSARSLVIKGKPAYMSPEQITADALDPRSDLYSVGVVAWELLVGQRLHTGGTNEAFNEILHRDPPRPSSARPRGLPRDLEAVVMKLLAREKNKRYQNAEQVIQALTACAENPRNGRSELAHLLAEKFPGETKPVTPHDDSARNVATAYQRPAVVAAVATGTAPSTLGSAASQSNETPRERRRWPLVAALIGTLGVGAVVSRVVLSPQRPQVPPSNSVGTAQTLHDAAPVVAIVLDASVAVPIATVPAHGSVPPDAHATVAIVIDAGMPASPLDTGAGSATAVAAVRRPTPTAYGDLEVYINPWAEVVVDGKSLGQTPILKRKLPVGKHLVLIKNTTKQKAVTVNITTTSPVVIDEKW